ncbi:MAG: hypothetical protein EXR65_01470 [Dehalococcoidia bacterium]|nr:hypothetical protein [Dehalococcoidia bacterium]
MTGLAEPSEIAPAAAQQRTLLAGALAAREPGRLQLRFRVAVLRRYRERGAQMQRTRTVGRVALAGRWSLDLGIAPDGTVHLPFAEFVARLPEQEWPHWIEHLAAEPFSAAFLQMWQAAGACIDDGETQAWEL